ncbi:chemotaxis protein CheW [Pseudomonas indica]|uniref:Purine-binding chemotaxis protein CheW n=1 Tax=Pseudomonas indica TaxID=137658 RepID=A0A1G8ZW67_9PSED|nr:chemotaxis protein CheW [Pseudomonas indica]SDK19207.1 purine-binding chemotaxis protein CheW [Pseudomonas indica]
MANPDNRDAAAWTRIRQSLDELERRIESGFALSAEEREQRLLERTREWARRPEQEVPDAFLEVLAFSLGGETYAVESRHVAEVLPLAQYTPLPGTPAYVLGIVNVRGRIVSVLDLRILFELPVSGLADKNFLVVLQDESMEFGLLVDRVLGIQSLEKATLQSGMASLTGVRASYLLGVTPTQWTVLDGARLLGDASLRVEIDG